MLFYRQFLDPETCLLQAGKFRMIFRNSENLTFNIEQGLAVGYLNAKIKMLSG
jgi:hypothetical protein